MVVCIMVLCDCSRRILEGGNQKNIKSKTPLQSEEIKNIV